jgi:hypothetical protein
MDTPVLIEDRIADGQRFLEQLVRDDVPFSGAFWLLPHEDASWHFHLALPLAWIQRGDAYRRVFAGLTRLEPCAVLPSDMILISDEEPLVRAILELRQRWPERWPGRIRGVHLEGFTHTEIYLYAPVERWANYPSLLAERKAREPADDRIELIRSVMNKGQHYLTLPPSTTPIMALPASAVQFPDRDAPEPLDWEGLHRYLQNGGRVKLHARAS